MCDVLGRIKKPKTHRYPSLKGTDPKFRRNHRHALHGTMKALVCLYFMSILASRDIWTGNEELTVATEGGEGGQEGCGIDGPFRGLSA